MSKQLEFTNREDVLKIIKENLDRYINNEIPFNTIMIFGIGGIGKSRLIEKIEIEYKKYKFQMRKISFEIANKDSELFGLIRIRKQFPKISFPLFDYAICIFHAKYQILADDIIQSDKVNFGDDFSNIASEFFLGSQTIIALMKIMKKTKLKYGYINENPKDLELIENADINSCIHLLNQLLAKDIKNNCKKRQLFLIDAYNIHYSLDEKGIWLKQFISNINKGFFIITGREKLGWDKTFTTDNYQEIVLKEFPVDATEKLLKECLQQKDYVYIPKIIEVTEDIPFYINLIIDIYNNDHEIEWNLIEKKENLISKFINHFSENEQILIKVLCKIRIFDIYIVETMIRDLDLKINKLEISSLFQTSLFEYLTKDNYFYKFHDILVKNNHYYSKGTTLISIYNTYFETIYLHLNLYTADQCKILFDNVLYLISNVNVLDMHKCIESCIDVLIGIIDNGVQVEINDLPYFNDSISDLILLLKGFWLKKRNTSLNSETLSQIKSPNNFGRHKKTYDVLNFYSDSLLNGYSCYQDNMKKLDNTLTDSESVFWYYGRIKNYLGESYMLQGDIKQSVEFLLEHLNKFNLLTNDRYQTMRHIGHSYRFSFQLDQAIKYYGDCMAEYKSNTCLADIYTNLAETYCYINPQECLGYCEKALALCKGLDRKKALAKIYYSKAIAYILLKKPLRRANTYINKSIKLNKEDGYKAGLIFTYMAKAYIEFAQNKYVNQETIDIIMNLIDELDVYHFFKYYISRLTNKDDYELYFNRYNWVIPDITKQYFETFIQLLKAL